MFKVKYPFLNQYSVHIKYKLSQLNEHHSIYIIKKQIQQYQFLY